MVYTLVSGDGQKVRVDRHHLSRASGTLSMMMEQSQVYKNSNLVVIRKRMGNIFEMSFPYEFSFSRCILKG